MPPSDFSVLVKLRTQTHAWKSRAVLAAKQLSGFHYYTFSMYSPETNPLITTIIIIMLV